MDNTPKLSQGMTYTYMEVEVCESEVSQSCPTLCNLMDGSP